MGPVLRGLGAAVRRLVLGNGARDDTALPPCWGGGAPPRAGPRPPRPGPPAGPFDRRLRAHVERAEAGSLAAALASTTTAPGTDPVGQVPHWLSGFDAAGIAAYRALALLATHAPQATQVRNELAVTDLTEPRPLPYTRACVLESVRLWPTTPFLLREAVRETAWGEGTLPAGTEFLIYTPFFQRGGSALLRPLHPGDLARRHRGGHRRPVPLQRGTGRLPRRGRGAVRDLHAARRAAGTPRLLPERPGRLRPDRPLPRTLDHFGLRFAVLPY